jgi:hypothetical protein
VRVKTRENAEWAEVAEFRGEEKRLNSKGSKSSKGEKGESGR